jgi:nitrite reductase/ring-hydroxylating ferredoxin subunit
MDPGTGLAQKRRLRVTEGRERRLCQAADIAEGTARGFAFGDMDKDLIFVMRHGGALRAYYNACPHMAGAPLPWRKDAYLSADRSLIVCHAHGARFHPESGLCVLGPCVGQSLRVAPIRVDEDGVIVFQEKLREEDNDHASSD